MLLLSIKKTLITQNDQEEFIPWTQECFDSKIFINIYL